MSHFFQEETKKVPHCSDHSVKSVACFLSIRKSRSKLFNPFIIISKMLFDGTQKSWQNLSQLEYIKMHLRSPSSTIIS